MNVLVDTSIWIEYFSRRPKIDVTPLQLMIEERRCVACLPIMAEILSGKLAASARETVTRAFEALLFIDADWKTLDTWLRIADLAHEALRHKMGVPGLVDRMVLLSTREAGALLWTLDLRLHRLARYFDVAFEG